VSEPGKPAAGPKHLLHVFPSFAVGGSQMRFAKLAKLHGARYRHSVISLDGNLEMVARLGDPEIVCTALNQPKSSFMANTLCYRKILAIKQPDVLVTYNWGAMEWALANRFFSLARHIHIEDGFGSDEANSQITRRVWMRRVALSGPHSTVVVPSRKLEEIALSTWKVNAKQFSFIPNGVDCNRFGNVPAPAPRHSVNIGTVASLRPEKNIGRLITAFDRVFGKEAHVQLLIVGDGPDRAALERMVQGLAARERIRFAGESATPERWMREMDIFALSSDTEQMPLSILEAMASGLPVVSTDVGDVAKMVSQENAAFIVKPDDFALALERLIAGVEERRHIGAANRAKAVKFFSEQQMADRYAALLG
jgi:L-malate glycosyltransferase